MIAICIILLSSGGPMEIGTFREAYIGDFDTSYKMLFDEWCGLLDHKFGPKVQEWKVQVSVFKFNSSHVFIYTEKNIVRKILLYKHFKIYELQIKDPNLIISAEGICQNGEKGILLGSYTYGSSAH